MTAGEAILALEDGTVLQGQAFGARGEVVFELVFNTSMTGYQEILTDPSYRGQGVLFTSCHIGNTGINVEDYESATPQISAVVVRSLSPVFSNWRAQRPLAGWLEEYDVPGISEVDTRYLTRRLRERGTMKAALSTAAAGYHRDELSERLVEIARQSPGLDGIDMVGQVTCSEPYLWLGDNASHWLLHGALERYPCEPDRGAVDPTIVVYDFGAKRNILRHLAACGCQPIVVPAYTPLQQTLSYRPDGIVLSNGPGDPAGLPEIVEIVRLLLESGVPLFGICLGHQLIGRALGGKTARLKFGHHGGNHPVKDKRTGRVLVTSQNHNYMVLDDSLDPQEVETTHISLNDGSLEGLRLKSKPVFGVQFHPEASPGPHDAHNLFAEFWDCVVSSCNQVRGTKI
jgi:carbamoyl-phosphate synthase small subunit